MTHTAVKTPNTPRTLIVPRWGGWPESDWYPWLKQQLEGAGIGEVIAAQMPEPNAPTVDRWVDHLLQLLGNNATELERTLLIGHSAGCQAIVRTLARLGEGHAVAGTMCVAGWFTVDAPWPSLRPWIETPVDLASARRAAGKCVVMISDNDPFTSDVAANRRQWEETMSATVQVIPGAAHFNHSAYPPIWETFQHHFGALYARPNQVQQ